MKLGVMATATQMIDGETAELIGGEFGHRIQRVSESDIEIGLAELRIRQKFEDEAANSNSHGPCRSWKDESIRRDPQN